MAELPIAWLGTRAGTPAAAAFLRFMASHLRGGTLVVTDPDGTRRFGHGAPEVTMVIHDPSVYWSTLRQGSVGLGRDYADGLWDCDDLTTLTEGLATDVVESAWNVLIDSAAAGSANGCLRSVVVITDGAAPVAGDPLADVARMQAQSFAQVRAVRAASSSSNVPRILDVHQG